MAEASSNNLSAAGAWSNWSGAMHAGDRGDPGVLGSEEEDREAAPRCSWAARKRIELSCTFWGSWRPGDQGDQGMRASITWGEAAPRSGGQEERPGEGDPRRAKAIVDAWARGRRAEGRGRSWRRRAIDGGRRARAEGDRRRAKVEAEGDRRRAKSGKVPVQNLGRAMLSFSLFSPGRKYSPNVLHFWTEGVNHTECLVLWRSIHGWANYILNFLNERGLESWVCTVEEVRSGDETRESERFGS
ncbi:uncharacterized protein [Lolium perenne]|uniref:uncharacterized protein isoform X2 n=1 Tax=Lolium perenne TaxID=4522 RepID=UPI0021F54AC5|nr:uncharacterized protein LOC127332359 isoform X3 [Lolium perenne]